MPVLARSIHEVTEEMEINWVEIGIQLVGLLGAVAGALALQCNRHSRTLLLKMTEEGLFGIQYLLLGGITGFALNMVGILRNLIFTYLGKKNNQKALKYARWILAVVFAGIGFWRWEGAISILIIFAKVLSTCAYGTTNMKKMRPMLGVTSICWIVYNAYIGSIFGVVSDSANLLSCLISIVRYDILKQQEKPKA